MDVKRLEQEQLRLAKKLILKDRFGPIRTIGGADLAFSGNRARCAVVVCDARTLELLETVRTSQKVMPYIPGFLGYREAPAIVRAFKKLRRRPDILLVDGQGECHPRGFGLACQVGLALGIPTIGVAKSWLCGEFRPPKKPGRATKLFLDKKQVGWVLLTKGTKPLFISPGHLVSVASSLGIVRSGLANHRLPEPLRLAHLYSLNQKI